jgi:hypothetical protein
MARTQQMTAVRAFQRFREDLGGWNEVPVPTFRLLWAARRGATLTPEVAALVAVLAADGAAYALRNLYAGSPAEAAVSVILDGRGWTRPGSLAQAAAAIRANAGAHPA